MFIPHVWVNGEIIEIELSEKDVKYFSKHGYPQINTNSVCPCLGKIEIKQQGETVYIKGEKGNAILLECNSSERMRIVTPYSHLIPTWMKVEFNKFIRGMR